MRGYWLIPILVAVLCRPAWAQAPETITREQALQLSRERLLETLLGQSAGLFVEVERPTFRGMFGPNAPMRMIRFATAPTRGGEICRATVLSFGLDADEAQIRRLIESRGGVVLREHVAAISAQEVYKVVPEATDCRAAGRVIPAEDSNFGQRRYFTVEGHYAWAVPIVFRRVADEARANSQLAVECSRGWGGGAPRCEQPLAILQSLDLDALLSVTFSPCESNRSQTCVVGEFLVEGGGNTQKLCQVTVPVDIGRSYPLDLRIVGPIRIQFGTRITD